MQASTHGNSVQGSLLQAPASSISHGVGVLGITLNLYFPHNYVEYVPVLLVPGCLDSSTDVRAFAYLLRRTLSTPASSSSSRKVGVPWEACGEAWERQGSFNFW